MARAIGMEIKKCLLWKVENHCSLNATVDLTNGHLVKEVNSLALEKSKETLEN